MAHRSLPLVVAAALVTACGPHSRSHTEALAALRSVATIAAPSTSTVASTVLATTAAGPAPSSRPGVDSALGAVLTVRAEDGVRFALAIANSTKHRVELTFPDGRTKEFAVYDAAGREVWRWSAGRLFTQPMQARMIGGRDSVVFAAHWSGAAPGRYTVVAQLRSDNHPITRRVAFVVPRTTAPSQVAAH